MQREEKKGRNERTSGGREERAGEKEEGEESPNARNYLAVEKHSDSGGTRKIRQHTPFARYAAFNDASLRLMSALPSCSSKA